MFPAGNLYFVRRPSEISQEITMKFDTTTSTETASRSIRAISSFFSKTSPVRMRWAPLTSTDYGFRHILPIFYQYSTNNSKAFPRYFRKFLRNFPRIFNTYRKHRVLDHPIDHPISSQPLKSSRRRLSRAVEARLSYDQVRNGAVGDHSPK